MPAMPVALPMLCLRLLLSAISLEEALARDQNGEGAEAILALESIIRQRPGDELLRIEVARLRLKHGLDLPLVEYHLDVAQALAPENPRAHFLWAQLLEERGQNLEALRAYELAVLYREDYDDARLRLAGLYYTLGEWASAEKHYRLLAQAHPEWLQVRAQLASAVEKQGRNAECERELRGLVERYPTSAIGMRALASFYERTQRPELAAQVLSKLNPTPKKKMRDLRPSTR